MKKTVLAIISAVFLCTGCVNSIDPAQITPASIIGGYNPLWGTICADETIADGEKVATFTFSLDEAGRARAIKLVHKTNDCVAEAAAAALKEWVFAPAVFRGQPIRNTIYRLNFINSDDGITLIVKFNEVTDEIESVSVKDGY